MTVGAVSLIGAFVLCMSCFLLGLCMFVDMWTMRRRRWDIVGNDIRLTDTVLLCLFALILFAIPTAFGYIWHFTVSQ